MLPVNILRLGLIGFSIVMVRQVDSLNLDDILREAGQTIIQFNNTLNDLMNSTYTVANAAFNSSYDQLEALVDNLPIQFSIDSALSAVAALEEQAKNLGVDISSCTGYNIFQSLQLSSINSVTKTLSQKYRDFAQQYNVAFNAIPSTDTYLKALVNCIDQDFGVTVCLIQLISEIKIETLLMEGRLGTITLKTPLYPAQLRSVLTSAVDDELLGFTNTKQSTLAKITSCAQNIFNRYTTPSMNT